jgi:hypothetical protein
LWEIVHADQIRTAGDADTHSGSGPFHTLVRRQVKREPDEGFA